MLAQYSLKESIVSLLGRGLVLAGDPILVFFGVHSASFDDAQADVDDVVIVHRVAHSRRMRR